MAIAAFPIAWNWPPPLPSKNVSMESESESLSFRENVVTSAPEKPAASSSE